MKNEVEALINGLKDKYHPDVIASGISAFVNHSLTDKK